MIRQWAAGVTPQHSGREGAPLLSAGPDGGDDDDDDDDVRRRGPPRWAGSQTSPSTQSGKTTFSQDSKGSEAEGYHSLRAMHVFLDPRRGCGARFKAISEGASPRKSKPQRRPGKTSRYGRTRRSSGPSSNAGVPAYSLDLNPCDFAVWTEIERLMTAGTPPGKETAATYKTRLRKTAFALPKSFLKKSVASIKKRVASLWRLQVAGFLAIECGLVVCRVARCG